MKSIRFDKRKLRTLTPTKDPFASLARSIIFQQLSTKSATSIYNKFVALFPKKKFPKPKDVLKLSDTKFKSAGVSPQKISYLRDLAKKFTDGTVKHRHLHKMTEIEIREHLIKIKGIGPWTIDMFLIFALNRPDILPVGDLGIMKGFQKIFGLKKLPSQRTMERLAKPYAGKRTYLSLHLWQSLDGY
jgi:DNA-3-methyladenine glycosylase II